MRWFVASFNIFWGAVAIVLLSFALFALVRWRGWARILTAGVTLLLAGYPALMLGTDLDIVGVSATELLLIEKGRVWQIDLQSIVRVHYDPATGEGCDDSVQIWMDAGNRSVSFGQLCWGNRDTPVSPLALLLTERAGLGRPEPGQRTGQWIWRRYSDGADEPVMPEWMLRMFGGQPPKRAWTKP